MMQFRIACMIAVSLLVLGSTNAQRDTSDKELRANMEEPAFTEAKLCDEGDLVECYNLAISYELIARL